MARAPMPAPQPLESPAVRRSAMLARLLEEQRQPTQITGGYGELAARLLGQGITQFSANRAERAVKDERQQMTDAFLSSLPGGQPPSVAPAASALGSALSPPPTASPITNTQEPREASVVPAAQIPGSPMPPVGQPMPMADVPPMQQAPVPMPQAAPVPSPQGGLPPALAAHIRQLAEGGDLEGAQAMLRAYQSQQVIMSQLPPGIREDPVMAWLAATNPDEFTKAVSQQYSPQVVAEGGSQRIAGTDQTYRNPRTFVAGGDILQTADDGVRDVGNVSPTYADINAAERNRIDSIGAGQTTVGRYRIDAEGNPVFEAPDERVLSPGQSYFRGDMEVAAVAPDRSPTVAAAREARNEADFDVIGERTSLANRLGSMIETVEGARSENGVIIGQPAFDVGPIAAARYEAELATGRASLEAAAYGNFQSQVQSFVNDSLRLNNGVQTEGDAKRETDAIMRNRNNLGYVVQRLRVLQDINERGAARRQEAIDRRNRGGAAPGGGRPQVSREAAIAEARRRGLIP